MNQVSQKSFEPISPSSATRHPKYRTFSYREFWKRLFDVVLAVAMLPILVPVIGVLALLVRRDGGPAFFGHTRVGKSGKQFKCYKLRSMVPNAEAKLIEYLAQNPTAAAEWARDQKLLKDPRITPFGELIRRTSLDELPQIWNVLRGEMSFVGPRPVTPVELDRYGLHRVEYTSVRPGITGMWQISGRNDVTYSSRVRLDALYATNGVSFLHDVKIILKTGLSVLNRTGR